MAVPIALAAVGLLAVFAGLIGIVSLAVHKEDRNHTLTGKAPDGLTRAGRRLTGVHALRFAPLSITSANRQTTPV
jgi:hypothetical protein